ncbi:solute carrier family 22 member 13-like [Synchiropus picturatus]
MADFAEILNIVGDFGTFQKLLLFAVCFPVAVLPFHFASVVFVQSDPERHCNTDWILGADPHLSSGEQLNLTVPREQDGSFSRCRMFVPVDWNISEIRERGLNETTECVSGWVYHSSLYTSTIVTDFDLVCERAHLLQVAQTVFMAGILAGSLVFGPLAESFGRKWATQIPVFVNLIFSMTTGLCPNFYLYLASFFVLGSGYGGYRVNGIILATEWTGASKRSWAACFTQIAAALGQCVLAGLAYVVRDWRLLQVITAASFAVVAISISFLPESARWLLNRGRQEEAKALLARAAAINKRPVSESVLQKIAEKEGVENQRALVLIQSPVLRTHFLTILFAGFALNITYFSLTLNLGNFGMDIFVTQLMFGLSELPAHLLCIWLIEFVGRRLTVVATLLSGGLVCFLMLAFSPDNAVAITILATAGRFFTNWAATVNNVYVQELFPTSFRQTASGLYAIGCRTGGLLSPVLNMLAAYHRSIPIVGFSSLTALSGALCLLLPETRRLELPESAAEAEDIRKKSNLKMKKDFHKPKHIQATKL